MANNFSDAIHVWRFESGSELVDDKGNSDLTGLNTPGYDSTTPLEGNQSIDFNIGNSEAAYVDDADLPATNPLKSTSTEDEFSLSLLRRRNTGDASTRNFWSKYDYGISARTIRFEAFLDTLSIRIGYNNGASSEVIYSSSGILTGNIEHIGFTYKFSTKAWTLRVYDIDTDTEEVATSGTSTNTMSRAGGKIGFACEFNNNSSTQYDDTCLDEVVIWNSIKTTTDWDNIIAGTYGAGGGVEVSANTDTLTLTENASNVNAETNISAGIDSLSITEYSGTINAETNIIASLDSLSITEYEAVIKADTSISANVDSITLTEHGATISAGVYITATTDNLTLTEHIVIVNAEVSIAAGLDLLTLTEYDANVSAGINVQSGIDTLNLTEYSATIKVDNNVLTFTDIITLIEKTAIINAEVSIQAISDSLLLTENSANINAETNVSAGIDSLSITEFAPNINAETSINSIIDNLILSEYAATVWVSGSSIVPAPYYYNMMG